MLRFCRCVLSVKATTSNMVYGESGMLPPSIYCSVSAMCVCPWWCHQMETFAALLAFCAGNSPVTGEFPAQKPVTRIFNVFFDLRLNKRLSKQSWGWWFETLSWSLWRHCNASDNIVKQVYNEVLNCASVKLYRLSFTTWITSVSELVDTYLLDTDSLPLVFTSGIQI